MFSHQIAANAYLIYNEKFLLLKRKNPPLIWSPPGGHLFKNEDPVSGLQREVFEETGLQIEVIQPITTWFGIFNSQNLLSIDYLSYANDTEIILSKEHSQYSWFSLNQLYNNRLTLFSHNTGFKFTDFLYAWIVNLCIQGKFEQLKKIYEDKKFKKYLLNQKQFPPE